MTDLPEQIGATADSGVRHCYTNGTAPAYDSAKSESILTKKDAHFYALTLE